MRAGKKILSIFVVILFIISFLVVVYGASFPAVFLDEEKYAAVPDDPAISSKLFGELSGSLSFAGLPENRKEEIFSSLFTRDFAKAKAKELASNILGYVKGEKEEPELTVSLIQIKEKVPGLLKTCLEEEAEKAPRCKEGEIPGISMESTFTCVPGDETERNQFVDSLYSVLLTQFDIDSMVPDSIDLREKLGPEAEIFSELRQAVSMLNQAVILFSVLLIASIALLFFLNRAPLNLAFFWLGLAPLAAGLAGLLSSQAAGMVFMNATEKISPGASFLLADAMASFFEGMLAEMLSLVSFYSFIALAAGIILVAVSLFLPKIMKRKPRAKPVKKEKAKEAEKPVENDDAKKRKTG